MLESVLEQPRETSDRSREAAAMAALELIQEGMVIGLGSGRAVWNLIQGIAMRWPDGPPIRAAVASDRTEREAHEAGIRTLEPDGEVTIDLAIDGADEIDRDLGLLKGGGAALLREKIVIAAAERFVVVAESRKQVLRLGETRRLPVEVVRYGWRETRRRLLDLVVDAEQRLDADGDRVITDEGHYLLDCRLPGEGDLQELGDAIKATVGVVEHGLFLDLADTALLGLPDGRVEELHRHEPAPEAAAPPPPR
jgi:ribose 5-phosphate isomerase A